VENEENLFAVTTYPDSSSVYSLRIPYTAEVGFSYSQGINFSASVGEYGIDLHVCCGSPSLSTSLRVGGSTNVSEYVTTYSLSPFYDNLREDLSSYHNPNPFMGTLPWFEYVLQ
jgi:hypothetical protein